MDELAIIDQVEIDNAIARVEILNALYNAETVAGNAQIKKDASLKLAQISKLLDSKRVEAVKPALEEQRRINGVFKPVIEKLEAMSKGFINQVAEFVRIEEKEEQEFRALQAKVEAEALLANKPIEKQEIVVTAPTVKLSETKVWVYDIVDDKEIPRAFLQPNEKAILEAIRAGKRQIPGVKIYEKTIVGRR
jgi:hypothetical protein